MLEIHGLSGLLYTLATEAGDPFNWSYVFKHTVNLLILIFVLVYFLKNPVKSFLMDRKGEIAKKIEDSKKEITEAKQTYDLYMEKMSNLENEINELKDTIKKEAEIERQEIIKQAEISSSKMRKDAQETIKSETAKAKHDIQNEVVTLAVKLAEDILKKNIDESDSKRMIEKFVEGVDNTKWHQ